MACVELPKDAYGRAIPLDTGTLYKKIAFGDIESRIRKLMGEDQ